MESTQDCRVVLKCALGFPPAGRYHFELSFPKDNLQGIMYEPWHWRFVGDDHSLHTFYAQHKLGSSSFPNCKS